MLKFMVPIMIMTTMKTVKNNTLLMAIMIVIYNLNLQKPGGMKMAYMLMADELSFWTSTLSLWLTFIMIFMKPNNLVMYNKLIFSMITILIMTFSTWNFMMFYIMFEVSMILVLLIIMVWGYQPERIEAMMFMIVMTVLVSLPFLMSMMNNITKLNFWTMTTINLTMWEYLSFIAVFMMKMPTTFLHMWLPKVHVESPIQGSMILAAVLLKLGSYGLMRAMPMVSAPMMKFSHVIVSFGMWTTFLMSMICLIQTDVKTLIAFSSIVHMTMIFSAIIINKSKGMLGSLLIMLGHGMCSSGLFLLANLMYKCSKSRSVVLNKGVLFCNPIYTMLWFMLCMGNTPMPPSINMLGELLTFKTLVNWSNMIMWGVVPIIFTSSFYSIYLFYLPTHGNYTKMIKKISMMPSKYTNITMMHIIPMILIVSKPQITMI